MFRIVAINVKVIGILRIYILSVVQDEKQWRRAMHVIPHITKAIRN